MLVRIILGNALRRRVSTKVSASDCSQLKAYYEILGLKEGCTLRELKEAFIQLARRYHPDSGSETADPVKFDKIKTAYHCVRNHVSSDAASCSDDNSSAGDKDFNIKVSVS